MNKANKIIRMIEGRSGKLSGDASDVLDAIVNKNKGESAQEILSIAKRDDFIQSEIKEMGVSDKELLSYIDDSLKFGG